MQTMKTTLSPSQIKWNRALIWLSWSLAMIPAWGIAWMFGMPLAETIQEAYASPMPGAVAGMLAQNIGRAIFGAILGALLGMTTGFAQWLVLRRHIPNMRLWGVVTLIGTAAGLAIGWPLRWIMLWVLYNQQGELYQAIHGEVGMVLGWSLAGVLTGALAGGLQWLILRRKVHKAAWWILASGIAMAVGLSVGWTIEREMLGDVGTAVSGAAGGIFYSAITGTLLIVLLRYRKPQD
jgi:hypothetical protein